MSYCLLAADFVLYLFSATFTVIIDDRNWPMILILGTTASGKGQLAFDLAEQICAEIISIDSMKVYRRMDIGTAKPPKEAQNASNTT